MGRAGIASREALKASVGFQMKHCHTYPVCVSVLAVREWGCVGGDDDL